MAVFDGNVFDPLVFDALAPVVVDANPKGLRLVNNAISAIASAPPALRLERSAISVILIEVSHG